MTRSYLTVALLSDLHLQMDSSVRARVFNDKCYSAILDLQGLMDPNRDWWVINGDICDHGRLDELAEFKRRFLPMFPKGRLLVTTGNHEFLGNEAERDALLTEWKQTFEVGQRGELYHNWVIEDAGVHFILLANEFRSDLGGATCWISQDQLVWFENLLNDYSHLDTVVFMHQPLYNTVTPAHSGHYLCRHAEKELRRILDNHRQVRLWFSGHTHCRLTEDEVWTEGGVTFVGMGATSYMPDPRYGLREEDLEFSQCRVLEIYRDRLQVRSRDLIRHEWLEGEEMTFAVDRVGAATSLA